MAEGLPPFGAFGVEFRKRRSVARQRWDRALSRGPKERQARIARKYNGNSFFVIIVTKEL